MQNKIPSPKEMLMTFGAENPNQMLAAVEVNGVYKVQFSYKNPESALYMLHLIETQLKGMINKGAFSQPDPETPVEPIKAD